jgi:ADP-heptose:LPS heptosyltransferase
MAAPDRIIVIRLGALGDLVQSMGPFAALRSHHAGAHIVLLTTAPFAGWLSAAPYFDEVWIDEMPAWTDLLGLMRLRRRLVSGRFDRIYDLQTSHRSGTYFRLLWGRARPEWSGIAPGCSHPDPDPNRNRRHNLDRQAGQLRAAGIAQVPPPDLGWSGGDIARFGLPPRIALLVPGSSPGHDVKRWPASHYARLAAALRADDLAPVVIGSASETGVAAEIGEAAIDLTGHTTLADLASLGRAASLVVGNDTGPMHLIAATGCPSLMLLSAATDPDHCAPRGAFARFLQRPRLETLEPDDVIQAARVLIANRDESRVT